MPFGATAAVHAWHRAGAFLTAIVIRLARAPVARYVDDYFGTNQAGRKFAGGVLLALAARLRTQAEGG